jgi:hypothetical protein
MIYGLQRYNQGYRLAATEYTSFSRLVPQAFTAEE